MWSWFFFSLDFVKDGRLLSVQQGNVIRLLDPDRGTDDLLWDGAGEPSEVSRRRHELERSGSSSSLVAPDGRHLLVTHVAPGTNFFTPDLRVYDLEAGAWLESLPSSALCGQSACMSGAWHPSGETLVTGSRDGRIRVTSLDSGEVHLLYRHEGIVWRLAVHPDGNWIASAGNDGTVRVWPMPEGRPLHTLPYEELLDQLRSLTNYRVVPDEGSSSGYRVTFDRLPAWEDVPTW